MESELSQLPGRPFEPRLYARFSRRFQALVVDSVLYATSLISFVVVTELVRGARTSTALAGIAWLAFALFYEPLLVSRRGGTVGHAVANIRVVDARAGGNPGFVRALGRFWLKGVVGLLAFIFMGTTRRHQGLHDLAFGTTVEIRDASRATAYDYVEERAPDPTRVPAAMWRRVVVILVYSSACLVGYGLVLYLTESPECFDDTLCSAAERVWEFIVGLAWLGTQAACIVLGWNGRLVGARSRAVLPNLNVVNASADG